MREWHPLETGQLPHVGGCGRFGDESGTRQTDRQTIKQMTHTQVQCQHKAPPRICSCCVFCPEQISSFFPSCSLFVFQQESPVPGSLLFLDDQGCFRHLFLSFPKAPMPTFLPPPITLAHNPPSPIYPLSPSPSYEPLQGKNLHSCSLVQGLPLRRCFWNE